MGTQKAGTATVPRAAPLVERDAEIASLEAALDAARDGRGALVVIEGPAGIGKTRLLSAARQSARERGMLALRARGGELERDFAYGVVRQLLEPALRDAGPDGTAELLSGAAALAGPLLSTDAPSEAAPVARDHAYAVLHGLYWLCANLSARTPMLLAIDDAHWADGPSLRFAAYLARRVDELPCVLLVASRPVDAPDGPLARLLVEAPGAELIQPAPLSDEGVRQLIEDRLDRVPDAAFVASCRAATGGVPFLLEELVRDLPPATVPDAEAAATVRDAGPRTVARSILLRLGQLPPEAAELARTLAVLGGRAELRQAAGLAGVTPAEAATAADALVAAGILGRGRTLAFAHPIIGNAIYQSMGTADRSLRHGEAARWLAAEHAPDSRVALHLLASEPAGDPWAVEALRAAGRDAVARGAPDSAAVVLRRALAEPPPAADRADVLWELGSAETHAGEAAGIGHLAEAMESGGSAETTAAAALILGRALMLVNQPGRAIEVFDRAAVVLAGDEQLGLLFEGARVGTAQLDSAAARSVQGHVARLERRLETGTVPRAVAAVCAVRAAMTNAPAERAAALARRALDGAERPWPGPGDPHLFFHGCAALLWAERWDEVEAFLRASLRDAQALGSVPRFAAACNFLGVHAFRLGRLADAEADARLPLEGGGLEELSWYEPSLLATLIDTLVERGDAEAAARAEADGRAEDLLNRTSLGAALLVGARGRLRITQGRLQEGLDDLRACGDRLEGMDAVSPCMASWRSDAAAAHLARGEEDEARALAARDLELARAFGASRVLGVALRTAGLAQGGDAGVALLAESPRALAGSPARLELARSRIELGAALRRRGRRREARTELRAGLDLAHRCGAEPLAARAHEELLATGARPRRPVLTGVDALTPSERRIVELAAAGATNREIAQSLFVTARTVESHLTQAYRKLRVTSRDELGAVLAP